MEAFLLILGGIAAVVGLLIYGSFVWGFVCMKFYYWFVLPVFPDLPHITFYHAVGLFIFIGLFRIHESKTKTLDGAEIKEETNWVLSLILPWVVLGAAYLIKVIIY